MSDAELRMLERAASGNDWVAKFNYASALIRAGRAVDALIIYGRALAEKRPETYATAQQGIISTCLPWVEFAPLDASNAVRFYNVMHKGFNDQTRVPYIFTWDVSLFSHPDRVGIENGLHFFSQERLESIFLEEKTQKRPPTASAVHSHVLMLEGLANKGVQLEATPRARKFIRDHLEVWPLTWSLIDCDRPAVIQDCDHLEERDNTDIRGLNGYLGDLNQGKIKEGDLVKRAILCAEQSVSEINRMYDAFLETYYGAFVHRPGHYIVGKRVVILGRDNSNEGLVILCSNDDYRPVRLVSMIKA